MQVAAHIVHRWSAKQFGEFFSFSEELAGYPTIVFPVDEDDAILMNKDRSGVIDAANVAPLKEQSTSCGSPRSGELTDPGTCPGQFRSVPEFLFERRDLGNLVALTSKSERQDYKPGSRDHRGNIMSYFQKIHDGSDCSMAPRPAFSVRRSLSSG
ncbi:hypothetical protein C357_21940 [Citreicella sp. 357]|nr:hypothetical protein C357_21940 [Citreicella sp. 357]